MVSRNYQEFTPSHKNPPGPACKRIGEVPDGVYEASCWLDNDGIATAADISGVGSG